MLKNYRKFLTAGVLAFGLAACGDDVTITEPAPPPPPPETPNIVSFSVAPTNATIAVGQTVQASYNLQTKAGVAGTVAFASANAAVASVDPASGLITAVSNGTALISATATAGGQTATAQIGITVRALAPAQISIQSVTTGNTATPVALNNVAGQIEVNMNFNPGEQTVDSVNVFVGAKRAAKQSFVTNPAAGIITLSINTANYAKNSTTGVATVDYQNGASTISAAVYPRGGAATATNTIAIVLNNMDGWAADMSTPTAFANATSGPGAGLTFWGGPTAGGLTTVTVYPVIYTPGRSIASVSFGLTNLSGACNVNDASLPFRTTFGTTAGGAATNCAQEWTGGNLNNVAINSSIDNVNNNGPTGIIANTVIPGSTPNALRFDWRGPNAVNTPLSAGAHGFNWVNASWAFKQGGNPAPILVTDLGVGPMASSYATFAGAASDTALNTSVTTGADLAETNTNTEYRVRAKATDLLGNSTTSAPSSPFGVDKTIPNVRYPTTTTLATIPVYAAGRDTLTALSGGAFQWAIEAIDNRAGLFDQPASGSTRGVTPEIYRLWTGATGGNSTNARVTAAGDSSWAAVLPDGYRQSQPIPVWGSKVGQTNVTAGYYTYTVTVRDRAGNIATLANIDTDTLGTKIAQRRFAIDPVAPVAAGLTMPFSFGTDKVNLAATFQFSASDDLEIIDSRLGFNFPALTGAPFIFPASIVPDIGVRFDGTLAGMIAQVQNLTTPVVATLVAPDWWAGIQLLCGNGCVPSDPDGGLGEPVQNAGVTYQPTSVAAQASDVFGTLSNVTTSNVLPGSLPATTELVANGYSGGNITGNGIQVRYLSGTTVRQVSNFSVTLPQLARLHAFLFDGVANEWVYKGTVQGSAGVGSDNGLERFWDYNFGSALNGAGTYAIVSMYNGPVSAARGTALMYVFTK